MRWSNVWVIFRREVRDQLRDRRTLFMIVVLPILLYPTLGLGVATLSKAFEQKPRTVVVVGAEHLPASPALLNAAKDGIDAVGTARIGVAVDSAHERGQLAWNRVRDVLTEWEERIVAGRLRRDRRPS